MGRNTDVRAESRACAACAAPNPLGRLFCLRCTAPLEVTPLHDLAEDDLAECAAALLDVLAPATEPADAEQWRAYLSAFWLRPETALVLHAEATALAALDLPRGPRMDLGCGDGLHAALYSGWRFDDTFDAFQSLDPSAGDVYNHWDAGDFSARVIRKGNSVEWGIDIKPTAVARAGALGVFRHALEADATRLPVPDGSVAVIFSNMLRDLGDPLPAALHECRRVLRNDGRLVLSAMTPAYADSLYFAPAARRAAAEGDDVRARRLLRLDRGRSVFCQRQLSAEQWDELLRPLGLAIDEVRPVLGARAMRFWDVGLRPFTRVLLRWRDHWIRAGTMPCVKASAVAAMSRVLAPLVDRPLEGACCMHLLSVRKR